MTLVLSVLEQGMIYAIMALGIYITYTILDFPDLTVDGSFPLGAALSAVLITKGVNHDDSALHGESSYCRKSKPANIQYDHTFRQ